ncbi:MAG: hypothetical protein WCD37_09030 [Chloroflexia bacterium]
MGIDRGGEWPYNQATSELQGLRHGRLAASTAKKDVPSHPPERVNGSPGTHRKWELREIALSRDGSPVREYGMQVHRKMDAQETSVSMARLLHL